ncbi:hypothetical protein OHW25_03825 [Acinetobacter baumannii]|uniref:hypothetical protein n=1 Tax=Acinetobacter calcoaceticus/baumannii complex TaxID=909768 RepID=UPI00028D23FD|nr:hypothetical protein [Acinetobacter baumannii]EKK07127.1 hypothetical protein ACINNAV72_1122 [Acinetobacter baumannii Naval-72]EKV4526611.1 hypothetical protein [Acinetobacter baumannii]KQG96847.1 hypothetical protein APC57_00445 [Acinetobacter baumannii]MBJ9483226.1 hypothetical protein [Acinetobacter baumannii]MBJ9912346.1 hypothetical protein [Acinetobacter baumannii]
MKLSKLSLAAFMLFTFTGCGGGGGIYPQPSDKYPFEVKMKALLGDNIEIVNSIRKAEVQISSFDLPKKNNQIDKVISQLKKDGWVLKGHGQGVDTYCLGLHNKINIVVPISNNVYDYKGRELNIMDYSMNSVSYMYDKWGIDMCE